MPDYPITPIQFTAVTLTDTFWRPRQEIDRRVTIPYNFRKCEETDRLANFDKAAGVQEGDHLGLFFNDSDVFKVMEGAAYSLANTPDSHLDLYLDQLIARIAAAQEEDGYLYTARTIRERNGQTDRLDPEREGRTRWSNLRVNHELYNAGHLYEAAVAHVQATGKRTLLDLALKNADLIDRTFGPNGIRDVPGHQEIEMGLVKLYRVTGEERYLRLARFFLDERGRADGRELYGNFDNPGYMQDHLPVVEQSEAVGHAVRALYMYAGMADVAALTGDRGYIDAMDRLWQDVVGRKLYLTGGLGARHRGEAFGDAYELPNATAYAETCAAIAGIFWCRRLFLLHGESRYIDVLERILYNGFLSGISLSGDTFFYSNPLASDGKWPFNQGEAERQPWFNCSCCPTNVGRLFESLGGYLYAVRNDELFVNLYAGSRVEVTIDGQEVVVVQETDYPWDGTVSLAIAAAAPVEFALRLRIPGWAGGQPVPSDLYTYVDASPSEVTLCVNGEDYPIDIDGGYVEIRRRWQNEDTVTLTLAMPVRRVRCDERVEENRGHVALERGPLVYCVEGIDNGGTVATTLSDSAPIAVEPATLSVGADPLSGPVALDLQTLRWVEGGVEWTAIPYFAWNHRGMGGMRVWITRTV